MLLKERSGSTLGTREHFLLLCRTFPPMVGGLERYISGLFVRASLPVRVIAPRVPLWREYDAGLPFPVTRFPYSHRWHGTKIPLAPMAGYAAGQVLRRRPTMLISDQVQSGGVGLPLAWALGVPHVVFAFGRELTPRRARWFKRRVFRHSDRVVAISTFTRDALMNHHGVASERVRVIRPGVDVDAFVPAAPRARAHAREAAGLPPESLLLLSVGRLELACRYKGFDRVLRLVRDLAVRFPLLHAVIAGDGDDRPALEAMAGTLGVRERVTFAGRVSDEQVRTLYRAADVFVLPSGHPTAGSFELEGYGLVYAEAAASGLPSVGYRVGGVPDIIVDGDTGFLVPPDEARLQEAVACLLQSPEQRRSMGEAARRRAVDELSWTASVRALRELLDELSPSSAHV